MSSKSVLQECQVRSVLQERLTRVSSKSCSIVSSKGVLQECHLSVWTQDVSQMSLLEMWQISIVSVCQHTCLHSGSWASSCFHGGRVNGSQFGRRVTSQWTALRFHQLPPPGRGREPHVFWRKDGSKSGQMGFSELKLVSWMKKTKFEAWSKLWTLKHVAFMWHLSW